MKNENFNKSAWKNDGPKILWSLAIKIEIQFLIENDRKITFLSWILVRVDIWRFKILIIQFLCSTAKYNIPPKNFEDRWQSSWKMIKSIGSNQTWSRNFRNSDKKLTYKCDQTNSPEPRTRRTKKTKSRNKNRLTVHFSTLQRWRLGIPFMRSHSNPSNFAHYPTNPQTPRNSRTANSHRNWN